MEGADRSAAGKGLRVGSTGSPVALLDSPPGDTHQDDDSPHRVGAAGGDNSPAALPKRGMPRGTVRAPGRCTTSLGSGWSYSFSSS
jgi:hypothetical protein